jgi:hypothetical protein
MSLQGVRDTLGAVLIGSGIAAMFVICVSLSSGDTMGLTPRDGRF